MKRLPLHEMLKPLIWLKGTWKTESPGIGKFPTIKTFNYCEQITFGSIGQPMFNYSARSWKVDTREPLHYEIGFLKIIPDTNRVTFLLAHNLGVTTIEEGSIGEQAIKLKSTSISRPTEGTKEPAVTKLEREFKMVGGCLQHTLYMATTTTPKLTFHLCASYIKKCKET